MNATLSKRIGMLIAVTLGAATLSTACLANDTNATQLFEEGNRAYAAGDFTQAIDSYQETMALAGVSPSLLYNLGNAYYRCGDVGQAVLHYEKALKLAPRDADIQANLEKVRSESGLYQDAPPAWQALFSTFSLNEWVVLSGLAFSFLSIAILLQGLGLPIGRGHQTPSVQMYRIALGSGLVALVVSVAGVVLHIPETHDAVVTTAQAPLQVSPFEAAETTTLLPAGKMVRVQKTRAEYSFVQDPSGRKGWIHADRITPVWDPGA